MDEIKAHVVISGVVQGVGFRVSTYEKVREYGLSGYVKNRNDGKVEAVFRGSRENVERIIDWCNIGPPSARVKNVEVYYS
ncbi:MAG: acylphosphatase [Elusimicrobia bacterium]|nr:acylphosphatase [Elusimicrobiota bacterium]MBD3411659.1 acylphosphatase [Elusimicrobiota bacterium]